MASPRSGPSGNMRLIAAAISLSTGVVFLVILGVALDPKAVVGKFLVDRAADYYPFTVQNLMWLVFFFGMGELIVRFIDGRGEGSQLVKKFLPEDERTVLRVTDLGGIYANVKDSPGSDQFFLPRLIRRVVLQFQSNRSVDQANSLLNSSLELYMHEIDLRYNMLRYIMWLIPSLGFIGTVIGIALALNFAGESNPTDPALLKNLTEKLGVAFYTTLLALLQAAMLVFFMHLTQAREENALNQSGQYCMDNLINRLYER